MLRHRTIALAALLAMAGLAGCAEEAVDSDDTELPQGITLFTADPEVGVTGVYAEGADTVYFETVREIELAPGEDHQDFLPDGTAVNVSVRFTDSMGRNLFTSIGGHNIPQAWLDQPAPVFTEEEVLHRPALFAVMNRAGAALASEIDVLGVEPEIATLAFTAIDHRLPQAELPEAVERETVPYGTYDYQQYGQVRKASCCWSIGEHSAFIYWNYYYWSYVDGFQTNNHGRWASDSSMSTQCGQWNTGTFYKGLSYINSRYCSNGYHECGAFGGNHNCHDDTKTQVNLVLHNYWSSTSGGFCSGWGCDKNAPSCKSH